MKFRPSIQAVQIAVAKQYQISPMMILAQCRMPEYSEPRQLAMAVAMKVCGQKRSVVARAFKRNHKTVYHAEKKLGKSPHLYSMMAKVLIGPRI
jgi:chromosomal replication initiation ATPase DnaA|tara:strand:+ start:1030 stop:1311 length:282 start_codon:yes stop_codon:yes gene_type:complete